MRIGRRTLAGFGSLVLGFGLVGCDSSTVDSVLDSGTPTPPTASIPAAPGEQPTLVTPSTTQPVSIPATQPIPGTAPGSPVERTHVRIGSFNIQTFGPTKSEKPQVMKRLARIVREFDVLAVQEIRSKDDVTGQLVDLVNQLGEATDGRRYGYIIGPRLGRTTSKEQYAYIFDTARVRPSDKYVYTLPDKYEDFHREPFVARFHFIGNAPGGREPFSFTLINIHTDPDETAWELNRLDDAFLAVQRDGSGEDDYILIGDLNASDTGLLELGQMRHVIPALTGVTTNTRRTEMYDNIIFDRTRTSEYTGVSGVFDFAAEFGLTEREALEISDHLPVWADFYAGENTGSILAGDGVGFQ